MAPTRPVPPRDASQRASESASAQVSRPLDVVAQVTASLLPPHVDTIAKRIALARQRAVANGGRDPIADAAPEGRGG